MQTMAVASNTYAYVFGYFLSCSKDKTEDHQQSPFKQRRWDPKWHRPQIGFQVLQRCPPCPPRTSLVSPLLPVQGALL